MIKTKIVQFYKAILLTVVFINLFHPNIAVCNDRNIDKIIFSGSSTYPPFQWLDEDGTPHGFIIDIQQNMGDQDGVKVEHKLGNWQEALDSILTGRADAIAFFASEARKQDFDFSVPFYHLSHAIFSHKNGVRFESLEDLKGHKVAVVDGSFVEKKILDEHKEINLYPATTELDCIKYVHQKKVDACIETNVIASHNAIGLDVLQTSPPFWYEQYVFGVRKGNKELLDWINNQFAEMQSNGSFFIIYDTWREELEWHTHSIIKHLKMLTLIIVPLVLLALLGASISYYLRKQVRKHTKRLRYLADHDLITGLTSYQKLIKDLEKLLTEKPDWVPVVAFMHIQNIDAISSMFGRVGNIQLIQNFARNLEKLDFIQGTHLGVGFYGIVAEPDTPADEIFNQLSESCEIEGIRVNPGLVMGLIKERVKIFPNHSEAEELFRRAITAYSAAINRKKNWCIYDSQMEPDPKDLVLLHDAQHRGPQDMFLLYQPKLDLKTGYIKDAEALLRWNHPTYGMVPPGYFIPLLEQTGLIRNITRWVIETAIQEMARCRKINPDICLSVNISANDLSEEDLVDFIHKNFSSCTAIGGSLCLEITETGIIENTQKARNIIISLRDMGIRCAIDDFGTGHASMTYLSEFAMDEIKLDQSFIFNILNKKRDYEIVRSNIELAHTLGLRVTAEGIENLDTLKALVNMGCDTAQGYIIGRPMKPEDLYTIIGKKFDINTAKYGN